MITLPIKKQWFDMIAAGVKKEEYREIKTYYTTRIATEIGESPQITFFALKAGRETKEFIVKFVNGYGNNRPCFYADCSIVVKTGRKEWGAVPGTEYYAFRIINLYQYNPEETVAAPK